MSSPIMAGEDGAPLAGMGQGFEFGIDPAEDPELAMVHNTRVSFSLDFVAILLCILLSLCIGSSCVDGRAASETRGRSQEGSAGIRPRRNTRLASCSEVAIEI